jgi:hypothetical protein
MTDISAQLTRSLVTEYDFGSSKHLMDVGGGRVLLAAVLVPEGTEPARTTKFMALSMLARCDGKQRTRTEFARLLESSGLRLNRVVPGTGVSVVEGVPV